MKSNILRGFRDTIGYLLFKKIFFPYITFIFLITALQIYYEFLSSGEEIFTLKNESIALIIGSTFFSALALWFLFIYFANKLLTEPLNQLIEATSEFDLENHKQIEISLNTDKKHELNTLIDTFNTMSKRINESYINMEQLTMIQDKQKKDLQKANKSRDDFLANMSHELKTPLNSINVISSVMLKNKQGHLTQKDVENLHIINSCGNDLLYLINDVLDISKLEAGEVELEYKQLNFRKLMDDIKDMFEPQVKEKNLNLIYSCDDTINDVYTDDNRIKQIIKNLLSNALKFVQEGNISFLVTDENDFIKIQVIDDGIGIEKSKLNHIFDRFKQADESTTRKYGGTGLGLAICKDLLNLLGGSIKVESEVNVGSKFIVKVPKNLDKVKERPKEEIVSMTSNKDSILLLNNDPLTFLSIVVELKKTHNLDQCSKLLDFLQYYKNKNDYSLFLLDIIGINEEELKKVLVFFKNKNLILIYKDELPSSLINYEFKSINKSLEKEQFINEINKYIKA